MSEVHSNEPALLGGTPIRPQGPPDWPPDDPAIAEALQHALSDRSWGRYHGPHCRNLAERLAQFHGVPHALLCSSGTAAVELALRGCKVRAGDEVILAAYDFKGNFQDVLTVGATPVLVDLDPQNWNLDVDRLEAVVTSSTKAIIATHLHGGVVPMPAVAEIARRHGLWLIEDACQMPGAMIAGRRAGTWGDVGVLSFGGSKLLTAGRGGALVTGRDDVVQRTRLYTHRGNEAYPLSELQAAVLLPQLDQLDDRNRQRSENVQTLLGLLSKCDGLVPFSNSGIDAQPGYYKLGFQYDPHAFGGLLRDRFAEAVRAEGIALDPGFRSLHTIHSRRRFRAAGELTEATEADARVLTLHHPVLLENEDALAQIAAAIEKVRSSAEKLSRYGERTSGGNS